MSIRGEMTERLGRTFLVSIALSSRLGDSFPAMSERQR